MKDTIKTLETMRKVDAIIARAKQLTELADEFVARGGNLLKEAEAIIKKEGLNQ